MPKKYERGGSMKGKNWREYEPPKRGRHEKPEKHRRKRRRRGGILRRILLTASGGPFFGRTREELENVRNAANWLVSHSFLSLLSYRTQDHQR